MSFTSNGANAGAYTIRGVNTSTFVAGTQSPVALYIDDLNVLDPFYPKVTPSLRLFDVNRVEVLEGPQGTLFGSGSLGGAIRVISNKPNLSDFEAETENTISSTDGGGVSYDINGMVNIPLIQDKLSLRVVGHYNHDAGYIDNIARGENNVNHAISEGARIELEFDPASDLKLIATAMFDTGRPHDAPYSFYTNKKYEWDGLVPNRNFDRTNIYSLTGTYDFHWGTLTSISTYADRYENIQADFTTVAGLHLGNAVIAAREAGIIQRGGGHAMAAGFEVAGDRIADLAAFISSRFTIDLDGNPLVPLLQVDGALQPRAATPDFVTMLDRIGPFGSGNPEPRFVLPDARIAFADLVGTNHVRCQIQGADGSRLKAIAFRAAEEPLGQALLRNRGATLHLAGNLRVDRWQGREEVQFQIEDAAPAS